MDKAEQPTIAQADEILREIFLYGHSEGWTGNQTRRDVQQVDAENGWSLYVSNGALEKTKARHRTSSLAAQDGLVEALQFYANHLSFPLNAWVQPTKVDYSLGGDGHWPDGPPIPSSALLADQGRIARKALSAIKEQHHD